MIAASQHTFLPKCRRRGQVPSALRAVVPYLNRLRKLGLPKLPRVPKVPRGCSYPLDVHGVRVLVSVPGAQGNLKGVFTNFRLSRAIQRLLLLSRAF